MTRHFLPQRGWELYWVGFSLVLFFCCSAPAADRYWIDTAGGSFNSTGNWSTTSGGAGGASMPGTADTAIFDQSGTYEVYFSSAPTTYGLELERGTVTLDLNDYTYTLTSAGKNEIGRLASQTVQLYLEEGSLEFDTVGDTLEIGAVANSRGYLTLGIDAILGSDALRPSLYVGDNGQGTLTLEEGADAFAYVTVVGYSQEASGTIYVRGLGSTLDLESNTYIGNGGTGSLSVTSGGRVNSSSSLNTGYSDTGSGSISVAGDGSELSAAQFYLGYNGNGSLNVTSGGRFSTTIAYLGYSATSAGSATVSGAGSRWDASGSMSVGNAGSAELRVHDGGAVTSTSGYLGDGSDSFGRVEVTDDDSSWTMSSTLRVGGFSSGELAVTSAAEVSASIVEIGYGTASVGQALVSGQDSRLQADYLDVGVNGSGVLSVTDGAALHVTYDLEINNPASAAAGELHLDGGSVYVGDDLTNGGVLNFNDGLLQVAGVYQPRSTAGVYVIDGGDSGDLPTLDLVGNSWVNNVTSLIVGDHYRANLMIRQGRAVAITDAVYAGATPGSAGTIVVESGGSLVAVAGVALGGTGAVSSGGEGVLEINQEGAVDAGDLVFWDGGVLRLNGGSIEVDSLTFHYGGGRVEWTTGGLFFDQMTTTLTPSLATKLLGPEATLGVGQTLGAAGPGQTINVHTSLRVAGGAVQAYGLNNLSTLSITDGSVLADAAAANSGDLILSNPLAQYGGATLINDGTIRGEGRLVGVLTNNAGGRVEVVSGERMVLEDGAVNSGHLSVIGGELQSDATVTNSASTGLLSARDAILRFGGGVTNNGGIAFSNGTVDVYGDIDQNVGGRITISNGGVANFYDDVTIAPGAAGVQAAAVGSAVSRVVFFGAYNGGVTGGGDAFIEGDHRPGDSPAVVSFSGNVAYGVFSTLEIELGGLNKGAEYDSVAVAGEASLFGTLDLQLMNGFTPVMGDMFEILTASESLNGTFANVLMPSLPTELDWVVDYRDKSILLFVFTTADFNDDGMVDGDDLAIWQSAFGINDLADADGDGDSDGADFLIWQRYVGSTIPLGAGAVNTAVPEPSSLLLLVVATLGIYFNIKRS
jgi:T5SS/PEP-CTERM-associated repeat protein